MNELEYERIREWLDDSSRVVDKGTVRLALDYMKVDRDRILRAYLNSLEENRSLKAALARVKVER